MYCINSIVGHHLFYFKESLFHLGPTWNAFQSPSAHWLSSYQIKARTLYIHIDLELFKDQVGEEENFLPRKVQRKLRIIAIHSKFCKILFKLRMPVGKCHVFFIVNWKCGDEVLSEQQQKKNKIKIRYNVKFKCQCILKCKQ